MLQKLVDKGNTVIVIEHNLDVIKVADYLIDMGPGGGKMGGTVVCTGTPEEVALNKKSVTAPFLREELGGRKWVYKVHKVYGPLQGDLATATLVAVSYFRKILVVTLNDCR